MFNFLWCTLPHDWAHWLHLMIWWSTAHRHTPYPCQQFPDWKWKLIHGRCVAQPLS